MKEQLLKIYPNAIVTNRKMANGDIAVYVNGQTAYNQSSPYGAENWLTMMCNAYNRSLNLTK